MRRRLGLTYGESYRTSQPHSQKVNEVHRGAALPWRRDFAYRPRRRRRPY